jgi:hypothetical protein
MQITKFQKFKIERIHRSEIQLPYYNPRKIKNENKKKLKNIVKDEQIGLVEPLIFNKQTKNLVGGYQRLTTIDELEKNQDYYIDMSVIDVSLETEIKINILLNQKSIQGEFDSDILKEIRETYPEMDFLKDLCFEKFDLDFLGIETEKKEKSYDNRVEQFEKYKAGFDNFKKDIIAKEKAEGISELHPERNDFNLTIIFNNNQEKWDFMQGINKKQTDKFIKYDNFIEFIKDDYR